jgi:hypothetical protein
MYYWITDEQPSQSGRYLICIDYALDIDKKGHKLYIGDWDSYNRSWSWCASGITFTDTDCYEVKAWSVLPAAPYFDSGIVLAREAFLKAKGD